jgi:hypothetical protein
VKVRSVVIVVLVATLAAGPGGFAGQATALQAVAALKVEERAAMTGYERAQFGDGWSMWTATAATPATTSSAATSPSAGSVP